ncbi:MAG: hypothetical protein K9J17_01315 [Flavobacteriales bacterium]|nr:hypothetical protein [Flavobacteriales bacterium]
MEVQIANFLIRINPMEGAIVQLDEGYEPFAVNEPNRLADLTVNAFPYLSETLELPDTHLYRAFMPTGELWSVARYASGYCFRVYDPDEPGKLQQICTTDSDFKHWNVYIAPENETGTVIFPLKYPLGPLLMYYLTVNSDSIMIHCSGTCENGTGRIFTGVSGKGKSTMARIWFDAGAEVLNDDRLIIRKEADGYYLYNTPMFYADEPRSCKLSAAYIIHHAPENQASELGGAQAVAALAANCIQHGYSKTLLEHHLHFLSELAEHISTVSLGFVPNETVITAIHDHELRHA